MSLVVREGQAFVLAAAFGEPAEQAGVYLDGPMDVSVDWRRRPRESVRKSHAMATLEILGRVMSFGQRARV